MKKQSSKKNKFREFKLSTLALKNQNTIFLLAVAIIGFGILSYKNMPKELSPEIVIPTIMVQTYYPGNPPIDIENLITRPLEKEIETVKGIKEMSSTSAQGYSMVYVEFNTNVNIEKALQDVKDAVDNAKRELPDDLLQDPVVMDIDFSEFPILNINLSGDYSIEDLKEYAEFMEEEIESVYEISKVDIKGINEREIKIHVDPHKMEAMGLTFYDVEMAINNENVSISGGELKFDKTRRSIRTIGEFETIDEIRNIVISNENGKLVYLRDIAQVQDGYADPDNFARLDDQPVVSLQVVKKSGENLLAGTDKIFDILDRAVEKRQIPENLKIYITNDQSDMIRKQLNNLENSMIMGVIFVVLVLFYFLGTRNSLFVGLAIPMSMFLSFTIMGLLGYRMNMIVLFSLILALGLLVDNAIVVVENIYRFISNGVPPIKAARQAVGEIALPIISSTATTLSAFFPLIFWVGITGEFMKYLPLTLIIVLTSSLFVALVIIPVFAAKFSHIDTKTSRSKDKRKNVKISAIIMGLAAIFYVVQVFTIANLLAIVALIIFLDAIYFHKVQYWFQNVLLVKLENIYLRVLNFALRKRNPLWFFSGTILLLVATIIFMGLRQPKVLFFPDNDPSYINVRAELPIGSDIVATDSVMRIVEHDIKTTLDSNLKIVESILTTVGNGAGEDFTAGNTPNKGLSTISFVDYEDRQEINTSDLMQDLSNALINRYPGVQISIDKNQMGPPSGNPINIEVSGKEFDELLVLTDTLQNIIQQANIAGIEGLKIDLDVGKPEILIHIDREKARQFDLSTAQIASTIRTALFGKEISDFKVGEDEYPIQLRLQDEYRYNISSLMNQKLSSRKNGKLIQIPISAVASLSYSTTYGAVKRKDMDRVITIYSNVIEGYNATEVNNQIREVLSNYPMPEGYGYEFTGEQQEQQESMAFLIRALFIAVALILIILVTQFNSLIKPLIIIASVVFSTIGVFGGIATFRMDFVVVMTGIGIVSLAGIVVNNAIVLIDYIELLKKQRKAELNISESEYLPVDEATQCLVQGGKTRLRPVLLTAITTILGLLPLAVGMNINFNELLANFDPNFYFGGDMVIFWGPISWTVIFGLSFATFLTLIIVPVMYRISIILQKKWNNLVK
jgi:multidrug efflux pump subunit AcrB